jgi:hypothetical protein
LIQFQSLRHPDEFFGQAENWRAACPTNCDGLPAIGDRDFFDCDAFPVSWDSLPTTCDSHPTTCDGYFRAATTFP